MDQTFINTIRLLFYPREVFKDLDYQLFFSAVRVPYAHRISGATCITDEVLCNVYVPESYRSIPNMTIYQVRDSRFSDEKAYYENKYQKITAVEEAVKQKLNKEIIVRTDVNRKITIIVIKEGERDYRLWHLLQSFIPVLVPWQFADKPLTGVEKEMLNALAGRYPSVYLEAAAKAFKALNIKEGLIRRSIAKLGSGVFEARIAEMNRNIALYQQEADRAISRFEDFMKRKKEANITLMGLIAQGADSVDNQELIELFLKNPNYELIDCTDSRIRFTVYTSIVSFDSSCAKAYLSNDRSYFYSNTNWEKDDTRLFFNALFGDRPVLKLKVFGSYIVDVQQLCCAARSTDVTKSGYIGNPHIQIFHCLGTYRGEIEKLISTGDTAQAVLQCAMSAASLNMEDSTVMSRLVTDITAMNDACIELPNGNVVSPRSALTWLKSEGSANTESENGDWFEDDEEENEEDVFEEEPAEEMPQEQDAGMHTPFEW